MTEPADEFIPTRQSLLSRLKDWDDKASWRDFFNTYWKLIYSVSLKAGLRDEDAQEVVQETMISVAKQMPSFRYDPESGSFKAWLMKVTARRLSDHWRKQPRWLRKQPSDYSHATAELDEEESLGTEFELEKVWEEEWQKNLVGAALDNVKRAISPKQYQIFDFYVMKEWPVGDVVRTLRVSATQVYLAKLRVSRLVEAEIRRLESGLK